MNNFPFATFYVNECHLLWKYMKSYLRSEENGMLDEIIDELTFLEDFSMHLLE